MSAKHAGHNSIRFELLDVVGIALDETKAPTAWALPKLSDVLIVTDRNIDFASALAVIALELVLVGVIPWAIKIDSFGHHSSSLERSVPKH